MPKPNATKHSKSRIEQVESFLTDKFELQYNIITNEVEYRTKGEKTWGQINENSLYRMLHHNHIRASIQEIQILLGSDFIKRYNPIELYFKRVKNLWSDKKHGDYIYTLASYINAKEPVRFQKHLKKWMIRAVVCTLVPSYYNKTALILVGQKQNTGKSSWIRFLCPRVLESYMTENISTDKDSLIAICENFIINLDELSTLTKIEINALKSIFSKDKVKIRLPYGRRATTMPRISSFIGSTNKTQFLTDETGSVRFLNFEINGIDWSYISEINIDIAWSQAYQLWKSGIKYELTAEEYQENERINESYCIATAEMELLSKYLAPASRDSHDEFFTTTDCVQYLLDKVNGRIKLNVINMGKALKIMGFAQDQKKGHMQRSFPVKGYYVFFNDPTTPLPDT